MNSFLNMRLIYNNITYSFKELADLNAVKINTCDDGYLKNILIFSKEWLSGKNIFEIQTSGSTGAPKQIEITRKQMIHSAHLSMKVLGLKQNDTMLIVLSVDYIAGMMMFVRAFEIGMNIIVQTPSKDILKGYDLSKKIDFLSIVPMQAQNIIKHPKGYTFLNNLKTVLIGGGTISYSLESELAKLTIPVFHSYGMTETVTHIALRRINGNKMSKYYTPLPGVKISTNENECLVTQSALSKNKQLTTQDRIELMPTGDFKILGRLDNVINSGGIKIQAEKVEKNIQFILQTFQNGIYKQIRFIVCGISDKDYGETVNLVFETTRDIFIKDLNAVIQKSDILSKYEKPKKILTIPKFAETESGKISRNDTQKLLI